MYMYGLHHYSNKNAIVTKIQDSTHLGVTFSWNILTALEVQWISSNDVQIDQDCGQVLAALKKRMCLPCTCMSTECKFVEVRN